MAREWGGVKELGRGCWWLAEFVAGWWIWEVIRDPGSTGDLQDLENQDGGSWRGNEPSPGPSLEGRGVEGWLREVGGELVGAWERSRGGQ